MFLARSLAAAFAASLVVGDGSAASAQERVWDPNGSSAGIGGSGTWDLTSALWITPAGHAAWSNAGEDIAIFEHSLGGTATVNVAESVSAGGLRFAGGAHLFNGAGVLSLVGVDPVIDVQDAATEVTFGAVIRMPSLHKTGAGTLDLRVVPLLVDGSAAAPLRVEGGTLRFDAAIDGAAPAISGGGTFALASGRQLTLTQANTLSGRFEIQSAARVRVGHPQAFGTATVGLTGNATLQATQTVDVANRIELAPQANAQVSYADIYTNVDGITLSGEIVGAGSLTVGHPVHDEYGWVRLTGNNAGWTGDLTIRGGRAEVHASAMPAGNLTIGVNTGNDREATLLTSGSFTRGIGAGPGQVQFLELVDSNAFQGEARLAAKGGPLEVNFGGAATPATLPWMTPGFAPLNRFRLGGSGGDDVVTVLNPIALGGAGSGERYVDVYANQRAVLAGAITGGSGWTLVQTGGGTLVLSGDNTFAGQLIASGGTIEIASAQAIPENVTLGALTNLPLGTIRIADGVTASVGRVEARGVLTTAPTGLLRLTDDVVVRNGLILGGNIDIGDGVQLFDLGVGQSSPVLTSHAKLEGAARIRKVSGGTLVLTNAESTFAGGLDFEDGGQLTLSGTSTLDENGDIVKGPLGTGILRLWPGSHLRGPTDSPSAPPQIHNPVHLLGDATLTFVNLARLDIGDDDRTVTVAGSAALHNLVGGGDFTKKGTGDLYLTGDNRGFTGQLIVESAVLHARHEYALGSGAAPIIRTELQLRGPVRGSVHLEAPAGAGNYAGARLRLLTGAELTGEVTVNGPATIGGGAPPPANSSRAASETSRHSPAGPIWSSQVPTGPRPRS